MILRPTSLGQHNCQPFSQQVEYRQEAHDDQNLSPPVSILWSPLPGVNVSFIRLFHSSKDRRRVSLKLEDSTWIPTFPLVRTVQPHRQVYSFVILPEVMVRIILFTIVCIPPWIVLHKQHGRSMITIVPRVLALQYWTQEEHLLVPPRKRADSSTVAWEHGLTLENRSREVNEWKSKIFQSTTRRIGTPP